MKKDIKRSGKVKKNKKSKKQSGGHHELFILPIIFIKKLFTKKLIKDQKRKVLQNQKKHKIKKIK